MKKFLTFSKKYAIVVLGLFQFFGGCRTIENYDRFGSKRLQTLNKLLSGGKILKKLKNICSSFCVFNVRIGTILNYELGIETSIKKQVS